MADVANSDGRRFSIITSDDYSGLVYIAAFLAFIYSNLTFTTRCLINWKVFGSDDWAASLAQVAFEVQFALALTSLSNGLGKTYTASLLDGDGRARMALTLYGNQITYIIVLGFSKLATLLLFRRLFTCDSRTFRKLCDFVGCLVTMWIFFCATFIMSFGSLRFITTPDGNVVDAPARRGPVQFARYTVTAITDIITEIILVLLPTYLVSYLEMPRKLKIQVIAVFSFRLALIPLALLTLKKFQTANDGDNPGVDRALAVMYQQCQLCLSLIVATLPCLISFNRSFDTGSG